MSFDSKDIKMNVYRELFSDFSENEINEALEPLKEETSMTSKWDEDLLDDDYSFYWKV